MSSPTSPTSNQAVTTGSRRAGPQAASGSSPSPLMATSGVLGGSWHYVAMTDATQASAAGEVITDLGHEVFQIDTRMAGYPGITASFLIRGERPCLVETGT